MAYLVSKYWNENVRDYLLLNCRYLSIVLASVIHILKLFHIYLDIYHKQLRLKTILITVVFKKRYFRPVAQNTCKNIMVSSKLAVIVHYISLRFFCLL